MSDKSEELKPCPWCKICSDEVLYQPPLLILEINRRIADSYRLTCDKCGAAGPIGDTKEAAFLAWNERDV